MTCKLSAKGDQKVLSVELKRLHTACRQEWVEIKLTWLLQLNSRDNPRAVGKNRWKSDQHGGWS
ncbi:hypothetical protein GALMADRAFT_260385 [Galerina marginata CBS 339.88]|uniref:Uncharacterized protein n=1 Tax=Galerina marginata (strain CBS 339.88) TaxID=685588 RepID=A0A067SB85_GALM3|nr:hypothetical protein GALMADRAFT_260385 [Galerina marginata CBS 339.88]